MYKKSGIFCMILGAALIISALGLIIYNENEDKQAAKASESVMSNLYELTKDENTSDIYTVPATEISNAVDSGFEDNTDDTSSDNTTEAVPPNTQAESYVDFGSDPNYSIEDLNVSVAKVDGYEYIGYITIPSLGIELPVMSDWSYNRLKISPCRYSGLHYTDDLVIAAHNYKRHFGKISRLKVGDTVIFTDMNGVSIFYTVMLTETLYPKETEAMKNSQWDLTLFTCTYGGASRVTVRCNRS